MTPKRFQIRRQKGWQMPENSVLVSRPSKWGNVFKVQGDMVYANASHKRKILNPWVFIEVHDDKQAAKVRCVELYEEWVRGISDGLLYQNTHLVKPCPFTIMDIKNELNGKNLVCWCDLSHRCHADVLLKIANS